MYDGRFKTILETILNGDLSKEETERRLQAEIDRELSRPLDAEVDMELVEKCQELIWALKTNGKIPYPDHLQENKQKLIQKLERSSDGKQRAFFRRFVVVAAALVLVLGVSLVSIRWIGAHSSPDGQQYIVQGYEISTDLIKKCIAEHEYSEQYTTALRSEAEAYMGYEIPLPSELLGRYTCQKYQIDALPLWVQCICRYSCDDYAVSITVYYLTEPNDSVLFFEQDNRGETLSIAGAEVYVSSNVDNTALTWIEDNIVYDMLGQFTVEQGLDIVSEIRGKR